MRTVPKARSCNRIFRPCTREIQTSAHQQIAKESGRTLFCGYREMFAPTISSLVMNGVRDSASCRCSEASAVNQYRKRCGCSPIFLAGRRHVVEGSVPQCPWPRVRQQFLARSDFLIGRPDLIGASQATGLPALLGGDPGGSRLRGAHPANARRDFGCLNRSPVVLPSDPETSGRYPR